MSTPDRSIEQPNRIGHRVRTEVHVALRRWEAPGVCRAIAYNCPQIARTPGTRLGPYEVIAPLGAGGMGVVYRARDTKLDRDVAIKVRRLRQLT